MRRAVASDEGRHAASSASLTVLSFVSRRLPCFRPEVARRFVASKIRLEC